MTRNSLLLGAFILVFVVVATIVGIQRYADKTIAAITDFESCAKAGFPILESYPSQCRTSDGRSFIQDIGNELDQSNLIRIDVPRPNTQVTSPLVVRGQARGTWFFEADFPVSLIDGEGNVLTTGIAQAQGDWMTTEFVPFEVTLTFSSNKAQPGTLILTKNNPSGLSEHDDELVVPLILEKMMSTSTPQTKTTPPIVAKQCKKTGCSGQICSDQDMASTCEYRAEYACYQSARCELQTDGQCGWTQTPELMSCLDNPSPY